MTAAGHVRGSVVQDRLSNVAHDKDIVGAPVERVATTDDSDEVASDYSADEEDVLDFISQCEQNHITEETNGNCTSPTTTTFRAQTLSNSKSQTPSKIAPRRDTLSTQDDLEESRLRKTLRATGPQSFLETYLFQQRHPARAILSAFGLRLPSSLDDFEDVELLPILRTYLSREFQKREKLPHVNTLDDVSRLLLASRHVVVITGAGISTSLGIPDFRSENGIYSKLEKYQLSDPQELFDIHLFRQDPSIFYDFCKELVPVDRGYSRTHAFIRLLQDKGILLRQYTQNIDDIESIAGISQEKLVQCHGSFRTARCLRCDDVQPGGSIFEDVMAGRVPKCRACLDLCRASTGTSSTTNTRKRRRRNNHDDYAYGGSSDGDKDNDHEEIAETQGVMKPDITFFGEQLSTSFKTQIVADREVADLVLCVGTSLRVAPVAEIPNLLRREVPQVFISMEPAGKEYVFDVELLGPCDEVVADLAKRAGWEHELETIVKLGVAQP